MKLSTLLKAHLLAFAWYGAVPREILYDNMKTAWIYTAGQWTVNSGLLRLASACGFTPRRCRVRRPQTKGKVERFIGYLAHNFLPRVATTEATTIADLNDAVTRWLLDIDQKQIGGLRTTRQERFEQEKPFMNPWIPEAAPDVRFMKDLVVSREALVTYQTNRYSVPADLIGEMVTLKIDTTTNEADIMHERTVVRSMVLHPAHAHYLDRRPKDLDSLQLRWARENTAGPAKPVLSEPDIKTDHAHTHREIEVDTRHPSEYENIVERSA